MRCFYLVGALNILASCTASSSINPTTGVTTITLTPVQTTVTGTDEVISWLANEVISLVSKI